MPVNLKPPSMPSTGVNGMHKAVHLTKTRYVDGLRCLKKLWLGVHKPVERKDPDPFSPLDVGNRVGRGAWNLFPGGIEVAEKAFEHEQAVATTRALMGDPLVPAIFEAAFEFEGIRVRVDILERLSQGWRICEVKSATAVKEASFHVDDVSIQLYALQGAGVDVSSVNLIHINNEYVRDAGGLNWSKLLTRSDVTKEASARLTQARSRLAKMFEILKQGQYPEVYATKTLCSKPYRCDYWNQCMGEKPKDWVGYLYRLHSEKILALRERGVESIRDIPEDFVLSDQQALAARAVASAKVYLASGLREELTRLEPPAWYVDFETINPGIPAYANTRPYEVIPFQWSLHFMDKDGQLRHKEFLADGKSDPRRAFAESLVAAVDILDIPIVVYNQTFELKVLRSLVTIFPDLADQLHTMISNVVDLLPVIRENVCYPDFFSSKSLDSGAYSMKNVLPVIVPHLSHQDLDGKITVGSDASEVFSAIVFGEYSENEEKIIRKQLLDYCRLDTLGMVEILRNLKDIV